MHQSKALLVGLFMLAVPSLVGGAAGSATSYVLGDSIGDGLATTVGLNNLAQIGIHIRGPKALAQIARTPPGATVYVFLGTNDAEGSLKNIDKSIDDVLDAAARRQLTVIWVGPHCVRKEWDIQMGVLDHMLSARLANTAVKYVSTRDAQICSGKFLEPDGVHLTAKGYRYLWAMIGSAVETPATKVASADDGNLTTASTATRPAPPSGAAAAGTAGGHRLVMEIHVPGSPSEPLVWTRSQN